MSTEPGVLALAEAAITEFGSLDVFVADAGVSPMVWSSLRFSDLTSYDLDVVQTMFNVNAIGRWL